VELTITTEIQLSHTDLCYCN